MLAAAVGSYWLGIADQVCPQAISDSMSRYILELPPKEVVGNRNNRSTNSKCQNEIHPRPISDELLLYSRSMIETIARHHNRKMTLLLMVG